MVSKCLLTFMFSPEDSSMETRKTWRQTSTGISCDEEDEEEWSRTPSNSPHASFPSSCSPYIISMQGSSSLPWLTQHLSQQLPTSLLPKENPLSPSYFFDFARASSFLLAGTLCCSGIGAGLVVGLGVFLLLNAILTKPCSFYCKT